MLDSFVCTAALQQFVTITALKSRAHMLASPAPGGPVGLFVELSVRRVTCSTLTSTFHMQRSKRKYPLWTSTAASGCSPLYTGACQNNRNSSSNQIYLVRALVRS